MEAANYADIIFFAIVAAIIFVKLHAALGRKDGSDGGTTKFDSMPKMPTSTAKDSKVIDLPTPLNKKEEKAKVEKAKPKIVIADPKIAKKVKAIEDSDKSFDVENFLNGAKIAFEMVIKAFNEGDKKTLQNLLSKNIYKDFEQEIDKLAKNKAKEETTLIAIASSEIVDAVIKGKNEQITVEFVSEQISVVKNEEGEIIEGNSSQIDQIEDKWVFERKVNSPDPNWQIIST